MQNASTVGLLKPKPLPAPEELDYERFEYHRHVFDKCLIQNIGVWEVVACMQYPDMISDHPSRPGEKKYRRGDIECHYNPRSNIVITVFTLNEGVERKPVIPMQLASVIRPEVRQQLMAITEDREQAETPEETEPEHINGIPVIKEFYSETHTPEYVDQWINSAQPGDQLYTSQFAQELIPLLPYYKGDHRAIRSALCGILQSRFNRGLVLKPAGRYKPWRRAAPQHIDIPQARETDTVRKEESHLKLVDATPAPPEDPPTQTVPVAPAVEIPMQPLDKPVESELPDPYAVPSEKEIRRAIKTASNLLDEADYDYEYTSNKDFVLIKVNFRSEQ